MKGFVPKDRMSKKARKEMNREKRVLWTVDPRTRVVESKKVYNRKRISRVPSDTGDPIFVF